MQQNVCFEHTLHPVKEKEEQTCRSLVANAPSAVLTLMPTHHLDSFGDLGGFHFTCSQDTPGSAIPISRRMFFGHTVVECYENEEAILRMMLADSRNRSLMREFLQEVQEQCVPAMLEHSPDASACMNMYNSRDVLTRDSGHWTPDVPDTIGVYHAMIRGYNRDVREHKMFLVCSGGLYKAADEFCNLIIDVGDKCDAYTVAISHEVWWLHKASRRSRCILLQVLCL